MTKPLGTPELPNDNSVALPNSNNINVRMAAAAARVFANGKYTENISNYLADAAFSEEEKRSHLITTSSRTLTQNKRETSFEGLSDQYLLGESQLHNLFKPDDKGVIFCRKDDLTAYDRDQYPELKTIDNDLEYFTELFLKAQSPHDRYLIKKAIIEKRQERYTVKEQVAPAMAHAFLRGESFPSGGDSLLEVIDRPPYILDNSRISLYNPAHVFNLLNMYSTLKENYSENLQHDLHYTMDELDEYTELALSGVPSEETGRERPFVPHYKDILIHRIDKLMTNEEIAATISIKYDGQNCIKGRKITAAYVSSVFKHRLPKMIVEEAVEKYLMWYFTFKVKPVWKKCSRCGRVLPAHPFFYTKNNTTKTGFYSMCKFCRRKNDSSRRSAAAGCGSH